jgi:hypothetical protein
VIFAQAVISTIVALAVQRYWQPMRCSCPKTASAVRYRAAAAVVRALAPRFSRDDTMAQRLHDSC